MDVGWNGERFSQHDGKIGLCLGLQEALELRRSGIFLLSIDSVQPSFVTITDIPE
jgi:hypothetical protein